MGYGDISPKTEPGRGVIMIFLLCSISLIPYFSSSLVAILDSVNRYDRTAYHGKSDKEHVLIVGDLSPAELRLFLAEWFHKENDNQNINIVIISSKTPSESYEHVLTLRLLSFFIYSFH